MPSAHIKREFHDGDSQCSTYSKGWAKDVLPSNYKLSHTPSDVDASGGIMLTSEKAHLWSEGISRSWSEGNLFDMEAQKSSRNCDITECPDPGLPLDWPEDFTLHDNNASNATNPFWNELSASNPFLDDITQLRNNQKRENISILKEDPFLFFREIETGNSFDSSGDDLDVHQLLRQSSSRKCGRSKSVSELLDILDDAAHAHQNMHNSDQILEQDLEWLRNDREAYKMAWLSQRHLARSCLDLSTVNRSPGWAQTQVAETTVTCKLNHQGGSVQLPESDITVHVPQGHVAVGEFQEVSLRAFLDPPQKLNHDLSCTISPLLEITLGNLNTMEAILLEMKTRAEVKKDPFSQFMAEIVCLQSLDKEGPFKVLNNCYIYKDTIQVKLVDLSQVMYLVVAARTKGTQSPAATIWDYIHKTISVGIYGPKYIHPSFTAVFTVCGHSYLPRKLTISDIKKGGNPHTPPVVFQLWGKHSFLLEKPQDLSISVLSCDPDFEVKAERTRKEVKQKHLQSGQVVHEQFFFSLAGSREMHLFVFCVQVEPRSGSPVTQFFITSPDPAPNLKRLSNLPSDLQKKKEIKSSPLLPTVYVKYPTFQDKKLNFTSYGLTQKTVIRQNKIEYLLEYFKGDTVALLGEVKVKAIGQSKVKEWYVGVLRGKIGLLHCKNIRVIAKEQVLSMSDNVFTTWNLLEQITLPLKKLTYIYSVVLTLVSEKVYDWKVLAYVLGYSHLALEDFDQLQADKESEKVAYVVKKLKEDCHADRNTRKFLYELTVALLKMDCQGLVVHLVQEAAILTSAIKLGKGWRELAEKLVRLTKRQMEVYEIPHQGKSGDVAEETCSWQIDGETMETVREFILGDSKITADGDCSHEIKRCLLLGRKAMLNLDSLLKNRDITLPTKMMWKPAYDFLYTWSAHYGNSYRDVLQDLQSALDRMKNPVTKQWRDLTGALILVNSLEVLRATAFSTSEEV